MSTMEEIFRQAEKAGWRLHTLAHVRNDSLWDCVMERRKADAQGRSVIAMSGLQPTAIAALQAALDEAINGRDPGDKALAPFQDRLSRALTRLAQAIEGPAPDEYL